MPIAIAFHHHPGAVNFFALRRQQIDRHFGPLRDRFIGPKFDAIWANFNGLGGQRETSLRALHMQGLEDSGAIKFASAHIG